MQTLSRSELLKVWEDGSLQPPVQRALTVLAAFHPEETKAHWARLSIGKRDQYLLSLREHMFGGLLSCMASCSICRERIEFRMQTAQLRNQMEPDSSSPVSLLKESFEISFRPPRSLDLIQIGSDWDEANARAILLQDCILSVRENGEQIDAAALPDSVIDEIEKAMEQADPQANVKIRFQCPACNNACEQTFDIESFLWQEIHSWAVRLMTEIALLARTYGWRESDILAMSERRREFYLNQIH